MILESRPREWWRVRQRMVEIDRPLIMGVLNVTPDSFSDGGQFDSVEKATQHALHMRVEGADVIDIGGESTRPQAASAVSEAEERRRVLPVVRSVRAALPDTLISVDTTKSTLAQAAVDEGADIINDVSGFRIDPRMGEIASRTGVGVVLMHSRGGVAEMATYRFADYDDVVQVVVNELGVSLERAIEAGVDRRTIVLDPGVGFAKRSEHSLRILNELPRIVTLGYPVLVGVSRKRFIGELSRVDKAGDRTAGTIGANVAALFRGARIFRVHDVAANRQALDVAWGVLMAGTAEPTLQPGSQFPVPGSQEQ